MLRDKTILQIGLRDTGSGPARFVSRIFCLYYKDDESQSVYSVIKLNNSFIIFLTRFFFQVLPCINSLCSCLFSDSKKAMIRFVRFVDLFCHVLIHCALSLFRFKESISIRFVRFDSIFIYILLNNRTLLNNR